MCNWKDRTRDILSITRAGWVSCFLRCRRSVTVSLNLKIQKMGTVSHCGNEFIAEKTPPEQSCSFCTKVLAPSRRICGNRRRFLMRWSSNRWPSGWAGLGLAWYPGLSPNRGRHCGVSGHRNTYIGCFRLVQIVQHLAKVQHLFSGCLIDWHRKLEKCSTNVVLL